MPIRTDIEAAELRRLMWREADGRVAARLLGLANVLDGMNREAAARAAGMERQTLRDWVHRFNAGGVASLRDELRPSVPLRPSEGEQVALFLDAYNFARRLKTLKGLTPYEFICRSWAAEPHRFTTNLHHQSPGPNI